MSSMLRNRPFIRFSVRFVRFWFIPMIVFSINDSAIAATTTAIAIPSPFWPKKQKAPRKDNKTPNKPQDDGNYDPPTTYLCTPPGGGNVFTTGNGPC